MELLSMMPSFGGFIQTVLAFVVSLSIIVFVHEYGHYIVGRWSGIRADVFSLGFGPVLFSRVDKHGTKWQFALIPFGGYVKFRGDKNAASAADNNALNDLTPKEVRETMQGAPLWARSATVAAGPIFNFIFSIVLFFMIFLYSGQTRDPLTIEKVVPLPYENQLQGGDVLISIGGIRVPSIAELSGFISEIRDLPAQDGALEYVVERAGQRVEIVGPPLDLPRASSIAPRSAAADAGLEGGDIVTHIDGVEITQFGALKSAVEGSNGQSLKLTIWRNGTSFDTLLTPQAMDEPQPEGGFVTNWRIGLVGTLYPFELASEPVNPWLAFKSSIIQTYGIMEASLSGIYHVVTGAISSCNLSGPIGIAETSSHMAKQGGDSFILFIAVISTAVGFVNLFPIPVLDGGHLVFYAYEAVFRRPPNDQILNGMMMIGLTIVLSFMMFALFNDVFCP